MFTNALDDLIRAVRLSAVEGLTSLRVSDIAPEYQDAFKQALNEYKEKLLAMELFYI